MFCGGVGWRGDVQVMFLWFTCVISNSAEPMALLSSCLSTHEAMLGSRTCKFSSLKWKHPSASHIISKGAEFSPYFWSSQLFPVSSSPDLKGRVILLHQSLEPGCLAFNISLPSYLSFPSTFYCVTKWTRQCCPRIPWHAIMFEVWVSKDLWVTNEAAWIVFGE